MILTNKAAVLLAAAPGGQFLLVAGVGHAANKQQRVYRRFSDDQKERAIGLKNLTIQVDGASDCQHGSSCCRLAALFIHLQTKKDNLSCQTQLLVH